MSVETFHKNDTVCLKKNYEEDEGMKFKAGATGKVTGKDDILVRVRMPKSYEISVRPSILRTIIKN